MIKLYTADTSVLKSEDDFQKYYALIDSTRQECVRRCKNEQDRKRSLLAGYLIQAGVKEESGLHLDAVPLSLTYRYGGNGKPYLSGYPKLFFNLSHSGDRVVCAFSENEIGVDIQQHKSVRRGIAERFFSKEDNLLLKACEEGKTNISADEMFYHIWSVKEAYIKLSGRGLKQCMNTTFLEFVQPFVHGRIRENAIWGTADSDGRTVNFRLVDLAEGYSTSICNIPVCSIQICNTQHGGDFKTDDIDIRHIEMA